jgi:hypothetical protein
MRVKNARIPETRTFSTELGLVRVGAGLGCNFELESGIGVKEYGFGLDGAVIADNDASRYRCVVDALCQSADASCQSADASCQSADALCQSADAL